MDPVRSVSPLTANKSAAFDLSLAHDYAVKLSHSAQLEGNLMLKRLQRELADAVEAAEGACQTDAPFEVCMEKQSHVLWLCNQCDYYMSVSVSSQPTATSMPSPTVAKRRDSQELWQIRSVFATLIFLKLLSRIRSFLPGPTPLSPAWQDLTPSVRLWKMKSKQHESAK